MNNNIESLLSQLVGLRSYVPYESEPFRFLTKLLSDQGFIVKRQLVAPQRYNLLAKKGKAKQSVLIYFHLDTVPPVESWQQNPLQIVRLDDKYQGLGCFDMKGGMAALLASLDQYQGKEYSLKLAFGIDEEGLSQGVYTLRDSAFTDDVVAAFCPEACIVPPNWQLPFMVVIGGRGRCVLSVLVPGITSHGAEDAGGVNAISQAALCITALSRWKGKSHPKLGKSSFFVRHIAGGNDELSIPNKAEFEIDYQLVAGETPESVRDSLEKFVNQLYAQGVLERQLKSQVQVSLKERVTPYIPPYAVSLSHPFVRRSEEIIKSLTGGKIAYEYTKSVADQNVLAHASIPTITVGPLGGNAHQAGEWVSRPSLLLVQQFYQHLLAQL